MQPFHYQGVSRPKAVRLFTERNTEMEKNGASQEQLKNVQDSLEQMNRKLELLKEAERRGCNGQEGLEW